MLLLEWLYGVLASLGLWQKEAKNLFLGLDNHPSSYAQRRGGLGSFPHYLLFSLSADSTRLVQHQLTQYPTSKELSNVLEKSSSKLLNLGGHQIARRVWKDYYAKVDAVVYLVDACDKERFAESKKELDGLLSDESLANVPFLILGNKIDVPYAHYNIYRFIRRIKSVKKSEKTVRNVIHDGFKASGNRREKRRRI